MPTTTLELTPEIDRRASAAARRLGISTEAFMVAAIGQATTIAERREALIASAENALTDFNATGRGYDPDEVHDYLDALIDGRETTPPHDGCSYLRLRAYGFPRHGLKPC